MKAAFKGTIARGVLWSALDRFASQGIQFVFSIFIARMLMPNDYGIIAILSVFIALFQTFVDSGLCTALVRRESCSEEDFSTVFYFNIIVAVFAYFILWFIAPVISEFYNNGSLVLYTRVIASTLVISSVSGVHNAKLSINLDFKIKAQISIITVIVNGTVVLMMAYFGYGIWALVVQTILNSFLRSLLLWIYVKWTPKLVFSADSFRYLFSFGSRILGSSLVDTIYNNIYTLVIGRCFSPSMVGLYSKASTLSQFLSSNITNVLTSVSFPAFSKVQDDLEVLSNANKKYIRLSAYIVFPLMIGLVVLAEPLITVLLKEQWLEVVPLLRILCFEWILYPIHAINLNLLWVKGRSDYYLRLEIVRKAISVAVLVITVPYGVEIMCYGRVFMSLLGLIINTYYSKKLIGYSIANQLKDILPIFIHSCVMGAIVYFITMNINDNIFKLLGGFVVGSTYYFGVSGMLSSQEYGFLKNILCNWYDSKKTK